MAYSWDDAEEDDQEETNLVKSLRKQIKDAAKVVRERDEELKTLRPALRKQSVAEILDGIKANPKLAGLVPADVEATKEAVSAWFESNKDLFGGLTPSDGQAVEAPNEPAVNKVTSADPDVAAAFQRMQSQETAPGSGAPDSETAQLEKLRAAATAKTSKDFFANLAAMSQGGSPPS